MLQVEHLRHYSDALLRLSREAKEPGVSAKLQEMADEFRIMVCVADVTDLAVDLARYCAGGRDSRQEADKDRIKGLPKRQREKAKEKKWAGPQKDRGESRTVTTTVERDDGRTERRCD
jgi:hypothetical protein